VDFATSLDKICKVTNGFFPGKTQEHSWERLLVVSLLRPRHMSFERSGKLVRLLIGLLFTEGSKHVEQSEPAALHRTVSSTVIARGHWPVNKVRNTRVALPVALRLVLLTKSYVSCYPFVITLFSEDSQELAEHRPNRLPMIPSFRRAEPYSEIIRFCTHTYTHTRARARARARVLISLN